MRQNHAKARAGPVRDKSIRDDEMLVMLWLHQCGSGHTRRAYQMDYDSFKGFCPKELAEVTIVDLQGWQDSLTGGVARRNRAVSSIKSLLSYGARTGYLPHNVGAMIRVRKTPDALHERILSRKEVQALIDAAPDERRRVVIRTLYVLGLRISEARGALWKDVASGRHGAMLSVLGKGGKTRMVAVPPRLFKELEGIRVDLSPRGPLLPGRDGAPLSDDAIGRIIKAAARKAGLSRHISAHWLRHACISHSLDQGMPVHEAQRSAGHSSLATTSRYAHARPDAGTGNYLD